MKTRNQTEMAGKKDKKSSTNTTSPIKTSNQPSRRRSRTKKNQQDNPSQRTSTSRCKSSSSKRSDNKGSSAKVSFVPVYVVRTLQCNITNPTTQVPDEEVIESIESEDETKQSETSKETEKNLDEAYVNCVGVTN